MVGQTRAQSKKEVCVGGIDPSLRFTGVCILPPTGEHILHLVSFPKYRGAKRLLAIREEVVSILEVYNISLVAFEGYSYNSVGKWFDLGEVGGVLKVELAIRNIETLVVPPASLKKFVTNNGQADKDRMVREVNAHYLFSLAEPVTNDNLTDAVGLAHFARVADTGDSSRRCELEAVKNLYEGSTKKKKKKTYKKFWAAI